MAGQGAMLRFKKLKSLLIDDAFVIKRETMIEHSAINTSCIPETGFRPINDCLLRITLKSDIRMLDRKKFDLYTSNLPQPQRWRPVFTFAKENGFDGISTKGYTIFLFGNKKIEKIEIIKEREPEYASFNEHYMKHVSRNEKN